MALPTALPAHRPRALFQNDARGGCRVTNVTEAYFKGVGSNEPRVEGWRVTLASGQCGFRVLKKGGPHLFF